MVIPTATSVASYSTTGLAWTRKRQSPPLPVQNGHQLLGAHEAIDPQAALAAADPEQITSVANGIGQMQPEWLREHFDQIPEDARRSALNGMITWKEDGDHVAQIDFSWQTAWASTQAPSQRSPPEGSLGGL